MRPVQSGAAAVASWFASRDVVLPLLLFAGTVVYVSTLPTNLSPADEGTYLYEAKRLFDGDVMYRDVFDFITPGYQYLMALMFALFGATITTARVTQAVIHGLIAVTIYATCRRLGVRESLALVAGLLQLVVGQSAWSIASQHWLSTLFSTLVLWTYCGRVDTPAHAARGGVFVGLLVLVQQQRGAPIAVGAAVWLIVDSLIRQRYGRPLSLRPLAARLIAYAGAVALIVIPGLAWCVARAGFGAVWYALVEFPLYTYGPTTACHWGATIATPAMQFTFPRFLARSPIGLVLTVPRLLWLLVAGRQETRARQLAWLVVFAAASVLSIQYFPDFVHIAFIAPVFYVILAENAEFVARQLGRIGAVSAVALTVVVLLLSSVHLARNWSRLWTMFPIPVDSEFGRVQNAAVDIGVTDTVKRLAQESASREVFVHPPVGSLYLMSGARNPTPHSLYTAGFEQANIITWLEARRPEYAVMLGEARNDPIAAYLRRTYEPIPADGFLQGKVLRRRAAADAAPAP